ncbi:redoxin family protein [Candidatus Nitrosocosmicus hydrocola]|uniref:redoxin family protein n=1 Tax=Candidatus Nitrosocosmicus hydrocola TaxID=1826872 RepID=UPI0011E5DFD7|nr:redoxin family protein [Candidatus Nitrosocosmicus hydrocola]
MNIIPATPAPEYKDIKKWNDNLFHSIKELKGKVILLDFWTYTCVFCLRTIPAIELLKKKYENDGLEVIGIHSAEYDFAKNEENIVRALKMYGVEDTTTGFDVNNKTWELYGNSYWPKHILIDKDGFVRYEHPGYGTASEFDDAFEDLLDISSSIATGKGTESKNQFDIQDATSQNKNELHNVPSISNPQNNITAMYGMHFPGMAPEICVGYTRLRRFGNNQKVRIEEYNIFNEVPQIMDNNVYLKGKWFWGKEGVNCSLDHKDKNPSIIFKYNSAANVNIITGSTDGKPATAEIMLDGKYLDENQVGYHSKLVDGVSSVDVTWPFLRNIIKTKNWEIHKLEILPRTENFYFYTFVFG